MSTPIALSADLVNRITRAGYEFTPGSAGQRPVIWTHLGEIRYFVGTHSSRWYVVTCSERMSAEQLEFAAPSLRTVELYLREKCVHRSGQLPADAPAPGFDLGTAYFDGRQLAALLSPDGAAVAVTAAGRLGAAVVLTALSWQLNPSDLPDRVQAVLGPVLSGRGLRLYSYFDGADAGGRALSIAYYRNADCKIQVYVSDREGETNCMIGPLHAPDEFGLASPSKLWQFLGRHADRPDLPLHELARLAREECDSYDDPLQWVGDRIERFYDLALAAMRGERGESG